MEAAVSTLWAPRDGSSDADFEDAFSPGDGKHAGKRLRFAVADGATESLLSGPWARLLVHTWCGAPRGPAGQLLPAARAEWERQLSAYLRQRDSSGRPVQWYEERGLHRGAHATFLGVQFTSRRSQSVIGKWSAVSVGDSCLFQVRDGRLHDAFPAETVDAIAGAPQLLASRGPVPGDPLDARFGEWRSGDTFLLATDAFSRWFLEDCGGRGGRVDEGLEVARADRAVFTEWVHANRRARRLANDDVTVVAIDCL